MAIGRSASSRTSTGTTLHIGTLDGSLNPVGRVDAEKVERAVRLILEGIGEDPDREGLRDTPARVARMYQELFSGLFTDPGDVLSTVFSEPFDDIIAVRDIHFYSICEHHLLPFFGRAHVAYRPAEEVITGLSKLARLVEQVARRPQVQERLTAEVADTLMARLKPHGVLVAVEAEHLCMAMRGVEKPGSKTLTVASRGSMAQGTEERRDTLKLLGL